MKHVVLVFILVCSSNIFGLCQIRPTGTPDSSFSVRSAYENDRKNFPQLTVADSSMPENVQVFKNLIYTKTAAQNLALDIYTSAAKPKKVVPAILMIHGGGWRSGDRSHNNTLALQFAAKGYVSVTASYSLSTHALYPQAVFDVKNAVRWMRANAEKYGIDTSKIAILGFSAGGQLAALVGTTNGNILFEKENKYPAMSSRVQAIIDIDGTLAFIHPESGEGDDSKSISAATYWFGYSKNGKT